jgi:hypothetical protein
MTTNIAKEPGSARASPSPLFHESPASPILSSMVPPLLAKRPAHPITSDRLLGIAEKVWTITLLSLPLDLLIRPNVAAPCSPQPELGQGSVLCLAVAVLGIGSEAILRRFERARRSNNNKSLPRLSNLRTVFHLLLILVFVGKFAVPLLAFWRSPTIFLPVAIALAFYLAPRFKGKAKTLAALSDNRPPLVKVRQWETESVIVCTVPMLAARAFSLQQSLHCSASEVTRTVVIALTFLLLMALRPTRHLFTARCQRCFAICSRSLANHFSNCPSCSPEAFRDDSTSHPDGRARA